jgi:hypothetical protein
MYQDLVNFVSTHGHCAPTKKLGKPKLSSWCEIQRKLYRNKDASLDQSRIQRLNSIPGWNWNPIDEAWEQLFNELATYARNTGDSNPTRDGEFKHLYSWIQSQRQNYREQKSVLNAERISRLEELPGWVWNTKSESWKTMFQELVEFERLNGHCRPGQKGPSAKLGSWVSIQRQRYKGKGNPLTSDNITQLESIPGWMWVVNTRAPLKPRDASAWLENFHLLETFIKVNGYSSLSKDLKINDRNIGLWVARQRYSKNTGKLSAERVMLLEGIPGWQWTVCQ